MNSYLTSCWPLKVPCDLNILIVLKTLMYLIKTKDRSLCNHGQRVVCVSFINLTSLTLNELRAQQLGNNTFPAHFKL